MMAKCSLTQEERVRIAKQEAVEHNARLLPEIPGYVRTDGPRRQYRCDVDSLGRKVWVEL